MVWDSDCRVWAGLGPCCQRSFCNKIMYQPLFMKSLREMDYYRIRCTDAEAKAETDAEPRCGHSEKRCSGHLNNETRYQPCCVINFALSMLTVTSSTVAFTALS
ncbi:hypothetical protein JEQ12_001240 [Ovis aries]|uniref:Uncharacterized protein n=1 Tax=Ovis aries TaxID=9940 RepID=A0A836AEI4_SHEEP|nr:hypothetical protein JEQ12_001240 [Ovis aries]